MKKIIFVLLAITIGIAGYSQNRNAEIIEGLCEKYVRYEGIIPIARLIRETTDRAKIAYETAIENKDSVAAEFASIVIKNGAELQKEVYKEALSFRESAAEYEIGKFYIAGSDHPEYLQLEDKSFIIEKIGKELVNIYKITRDGKIPATNFSMLKAQSKIQALFSRLEDEYKLKHPEYVSVNFKQLL